jgi:hypothetical protein
VLHRIAWVAMACAYVFFGLLGIMVLAPNTFVGADWATYGRAADDLWLRGDPYLNANVSYNFQFRYPPFLAVIWPVVGWLPVWWALLIAGTALTFYFWYRDAGWLGILPIVMLAGAWGQPLINGNVQPILIALLILVPRFTRVGAVGLAAATMLKLHPALGIVWYVGRRDWRGLRWFAGACAVLLLVQLPWADDFVRYYLNNPDSSPTLHEGWGLRLFGDAVWLGVSAVVGVLALWFAPSRFGWLVNIVFQLAAVPRLVPTYLALLLAAPLRARKDAEATDRAQQPTLMTRPAESTGAT